MDYKRVPRYGYRIYVYFYFALYLTADWVCLLVNTEKDKPIHLNKSLVCVPMDTKGVTLAKRIDKLGMRASDTGIIYFEDVRVPISNIIGQEGYGFTYQMMQVNTLLKLGPRYTFYCICLKLDCLK